MPFNTDNYIDAARHLQLDPTQALPDSYLRSQFATLESIDTQLGVTTKVDYVQNILTQLNDLENQLDTQRPTEETVGVSKFDVSSSYSVTMNPQEKLGALSGLKQQYDKYLIDLKRELGYEFEVDFNRQVGSLIT